MSMTEKWADGLSEAWTTTEPYRSLILADLDLLVPQGRTDPAMLRFMEKLQEKI